MLASLLFKLLFLCTIWYHSCWIVLTIQQHTFQSNKITLLTLSFSDTAALQSLLTKLESDGLLRDGSAASTLVQYVLHPRLSAALSATATASTTSSYPNLQAWVASVSASAAYKSAVVKVTASKASDAVAGKGGKAAKKAAAAASASNSSAGAGATVFSNDDVVRPVLGAIDWTSTGLVSR